MQTDVKDALSQEDAADQEIPREGRFESPARPLDREHAVPLERLRQDQRQIAVADVEGDAFRLDPVRAGSRDDVMNGMAEDLYRVEMVRAVLGIHLLKKLGIA